MSPEQQWPPLSPIQTGLRCRCPRCGVGHLFQGYLTLQPKCEICDLDYSFADPADGPAFFIMMFGCLPSMVFAIWLQITYQPALWVHLFTSLPLLLLTCLLPLRPVKGWLVNSQYFHKAQEGSIDRDWQEQGALGRREEKNGIAACRARMPGRKTVTEANHGKQK